MLSIGEFARYLGISVRMLRHYDALGLLVPASVDPVTGYRSYTAAQLDRANRLLALKDLGFGLDRIGPVLDAQVSTAGLRGMLLLRRAQVAEQIAADQARLAEIERRLRAVEGDIMPTLEFVEKPLPAVRLAQLTATVTDQPEIGPVIGPLFDRLAETLAGSGITLDRPAVAWYRAEPDGLHLGAAFPVTLDRPTPAMDRAGIEIADLPAVDRAVTTLHHGPMETIGDTWQALVRHAEDAGLDLRGPCREVYLHMPPDGDPADWVTELQQPVG